MVLINRLLPLLRRTAKQWPSTTSCRIVSQSSEVHRSASLTSDAYDFSTPQAFKTNLSSPNQAYARGKLANILFIRHLATAAGFGQAKGPKTIRALLSHPGGVKTEQPVGFERSYGPVIGKLGTCVAASLAIAGFD